MLQSPLARSTTLLYLYIPMTLLLISLLCCDVIAPTPMHPADAAAAAACVAITLVGSVVDTISIALATAKDDDADDDAAAPAAA